MKLNTYPDLKETGIRTGGLLRETAQKWSGWEFSISDWEKPQRVSLSLFSHERSFLSSTRFIKIDNQLSTDACDIQSIFEGREKHSHSVPGILATSLLSLVNLS